RYQLRPDRGADHFRASGLLVDPEDVMAIAAAIASVLDDDPLLVDLRERGLAGAAVHLGRIRAADPRNALGSGRRVAVVSWAPKGKAARATHGLPGRGVFLKRAPLSCKRS